MADRRGGGPTTTKRRGFTALSDQWMDFAEPGFDAEEYVETFFISHTESEADEKTAELMNLRYQTQDLLRQKVSSHYQMFMKGTEDIQHVEQDILALRKLVGRMQESVKVLNTASMSIWGIKEQPPPTGPSTNPSDPRSRASSRVPSPVLVPSANITVAPHPTCTDTSKFPKWVGTALEDLDMFIVEKQRSQAVALIDRVRKFFANLARGGIATTAITNHEVLVTVNQQADALAEKIIADLGEMTRTILYDFRDLHRQLRMLIILGKADTAVSFFIRNRGALIERSLKSLEGGGDTLSYVTVLSDKFFTLLADSIGAFDRLFSEVESRRPECFSTLVLWADAEVQRYAALVGRQLSLTRRDLLRNNNQLEQHDQMLTMATSIRVSERNFSNQSTAASGGLTPFAPQSPRGNLMVSPQEYLSPTRSNMLVKASTSSSPALGGPGRRRSQVMGGMPGDDSFITIGACLEVCFYLADRMDQLGLPVRPSLARVLIQDLWALLDGYARKINDKVQLELQSDTLVAQSYPSSDMDMCPPLVLPCVSESGEEGSTSIPPPSDPPKPTTSKDEVTVLASAHSLAMEAAGLVTCFTLLKEPGNGQDAKCRYSGELNPLDELVMTSLNNLLRDYTTALEKRVMATKLKKRPSATEIQARKDAASTLRVLSDLSLPSVDRWARDTSVLVDLPQAMATMADTLELLDQTADNLDQAAANGDATKSPN